MHTIEKALRDLGDKVSDDEKRVANEAIAAVKTAMAGDDKDDIERKTQALDQASSALMQKTYEQQRPRPAARGSRGGRTAARGGRKPRTTCSMRSSKRSRKAIARRPEGARRGLTMTVLAEPSVLRAGGSWSRVRALQRASR